MLRRGGTLLKFPVNLRLRALKNNPYFYVLAFIIVLAFMSFIAPLVRTAIAPLFKDPLTILTLIKREIGGIVFYHRNLLLSERLSREAGLLRQKISSLQELQEENTRLRELLSLSQQIPFKVIAAKVIGRSPDSFSYRSGVFCL